MRVLVEILRLTKYATSSYQGDILAKGFVIRSFHFPWELAPIFFGKLIIHPLANLTCPMPCFHATLLSNS